MSTSHIGFFIFMGIVFRYNRIEWNQFFKMIIFAELLYYDH